MPDNFIGAFAKGEMLQVVVLSVMVGIGILAIPLERRSAINGGLSQISEVLFAFINLVMRLAPLGTFGAVAYSVGSNGSVVLLALAELVLGFYAVLALFVIAGLGLIFGVYRFLSMAMATCNTIGNSVATVVVAKWSGTFDAERAHRHLYPELYPDVALEDEALDNGATLPMTPEPAAARVSQA